MSNELTRVFEIKLTPAFLACLLALAGCGRRDAGADAANAGSRPEQDVVEVTAEPAEVRTMTEVVTGLGRCEAVPDRIASLTPAVEGRVQQILLPLGAQVAKGEPIVQLDPQIATANLAEKTATRDGLKASLKLLRAPPRPEELRAQELAVEQAKLALDKAKATVERLRPLIAHKEISEAQMYEANLAVTQADVQEKTAEAQLTAMNLAPRAEAIEEAETKIATAEAGVETASAQLKLHTLESPINGVLDNLSCRLGQTVSAGTPIGEIVDLGEVHVLAWLPPRDAARVRPGQTARIKMSGAAHNVESLSADASLDSERQGEVIFVGHAADPQTGNLPVRIRVGNLEGHLSLGETVSVAITVRERPDVLAVPLAALFDVGDGPMLNIVRDGKSVRVQPTLGLRDTHWVEVLETNLDEKLKDGEMVIVEGGYNLPEGKAVAIHSEQKSETPNAQTAASPAPRESGKESAP